MLDCFFAIDGSIVGDGLDDLVQYAQNLVCEDDVDPLRWVDRTDCVPHACVGHFDA